MDKDAQEMKKEILNATADSIINLCQIYKQDDDMTSARLIMCVTSLFTIIACDAAGDLDDPEMILKTAKNMKGFGKTIANYQSS